MATATESPRLGKVLFNHDDGNTPDSTAGRRIRQVDKLASHRDEYNENLPTSYRPLVSDKFMGKGKPPARPPPAQPPPNSEELPRGKPPANPPAKPPANPPAKPPAKPPANPPAKPPARPPPKPEEPRPIPGVS